MSFFQRLFGARDGRKSPGDVDARLRQLEIEAANARPGYVGTAYNRAGDLAFRSDLRDRAAEFYGRAIDAFLDDGQREAARGVANKILRVRPGAARTLCTLIWLDLGARHSATALLHLRDYVDAARKVDRHSLAADQIYEMARLVPDAEFIQAAADALDGLDRSEDADEVRTWVGSTGSPDAVHDPYELADACLRAAVKSSQRAPRRSSAGSSRPAQTKPADDRRHPPAEGNGEGKERSQSTSHPDASKRYRWD